MRCVEYASLAVKAATFGIASVGHRANAPVFVSHCGSVPSENANAQKSTVKCLLRNLRKSFQVQGYLSAILLCVGCLEQVFAAECVMSPAVGPRGCCSLSVVKYARRTIPTATMRLLSGSRLLE